ncbi:MAG: DegT/DnrJ/EryC1/StrS family aminotransferase, partial [Deltaproteobacteria bacterium]|nr:DegT/DnrJ/EryC1/StrS family aminotransferase [Deltaproteobacteria bacterium]
HLDKWNRLRVSHAIRYTELLGGIPEIKLPKFKKNEKSAHVFHLFVVRVEERDGLIEFLNGRNISTGIHYPVPAHMHEAFRDLGYKKGDFPVTEKYSEELLSLPMFPELRDEQIMHVTTAIREFYGR